MKGQENMKKENLEEVAYNAIMKLILSNHFQPGAE